MLRCVVEPVIASGQWAGGTTWTARPATKNTLPKLLVDNPRLCTAVGVVVLVSTGLSLPLVAMTKQRVGRNGNPPQEETPSGHLDSFWRWRESARRAAGREVWEEVGAKLWRLKIFACSEIYSSPETSYPPVSFMPYLVGYVRRLSQPRDPKHTRFTRPLTQIGEGARLGKTSLDDAKIVRAGVIAVGYDRQTVYAAMGPLD